MDKVELDIRNYIKAFQKEKPIKLSDDAEQHILERIVLAAKRYGVSMRSPYYNDLLCHAREHTVKSMVKFAIEKVRPDGRPYSVLSYIDTITRCAIIDKLHANKKYGIEIKRGDCNNCIVKKMIDVVKVD